MYAKRHYPTTLCGKMESDLLDSALPESSAPAGEELIKCLPSAENCLASPMERSLPEEFKSSFLRVLKLWSYR